MFQLGSTSSFAAATAGGAPVNPNKDFEVSCPPDDSVSALRFSPATVSTNFLVGGSWDCQVRCWEVEMTGKTNPKAVQTLGGPCLDVCWHDDGTKVFMASTDKMVKCWDLASNQTIQVAAHDAPVKTCHWVKGSNYTCLMTGSWDKTLKFWDTRSPQPVMSLNLPERCYCADVDYPMAVVGCADRSLTVYTLEGTPQEFKRIDSPLKYQHRCIAIFRDKDKIKPTGFALGSVEGRVAIHCVNTNDAKTNFTFKCHRSRADQNTHQDIYAVNDVAFHPVHGTLATAGADGSFAFWDKDSRRSLKLSEPLSQPLTSCAFNHNGHIFAYAASYDWSKGHEHFNTSQKPQIYLRPCFDELKRKDR